MKKENCKVHFWAWFEHNNSELMLHEDKSSKEIRYWINELYIHLQAYAKYMGFVLEHDFDNGRNKLMITVQGRANYFKKVEELVVSAPRIAGWEIAALMDPMPVDYEIAERFGHLSIDPDDVWVLPMDDGFDGKVDLIVYFPGYQKKQDKDFVAAAMALAYNVLGERVFAEDMGCIIAADLFAPPEELGLISIEELPEYMAKLESEFVVDKAGALRKK